MKVIIAGSRSITCLGIVPRVVKESGFDVTEVVCGMARGVDTLGKLWAEFNHIPVAEFPADWDYHGKKAGFVRNSEMADYADALIAIWDGQSKGTAHMIDRALEKGLKIHIHNTSTLPLYGSDLD